MQWDGTADQEYTPVILLCAMEWDSGLIIYTCDFAVCSGMGQQTSNIHL